MPRHCAKGNYVLTKFMKMAEQRMAWCLYCSSIYSSLTPELDFLILTKTKIGPFPLDKKGKYDFDQILNNYESF